MKIREEVLENIVELQERIDEKFRKAGLEKKYTPTLIITSTGRDIAYANENVENAAKTSTHFYGIAFDIRIANGTITNNKTGQEIKLTGADNELYMAFLSESLNEMFREQKLYYIIEGNPPHIHVQSFGNVKDNWTPLVLHKK